jgi:hypothetical protein
VHPTESLLSNLASSFPKSNPKVNADNKNGELICFEIMNIIYTLAAKTRWGKRPMRFMLKYSPYDLFSAAILASIFLRAANIISSLLCCINDCLSVLFWLQAFPPGDPPGDGDAGDASLSSPLAAASFAPRLYRAIRSGWDGFGVSVLVPAPFCEEDDAAAGGMGGRKVCGGCTMLAVAPVAIWNRGVRSIMATYLFKSSATQYPLRRRSNIAPVSLQIPHYSSPPNLREHLLHPIHIRLSHSHPASTRS